MPPSIDPGLKNTLNAVLEALDRLLRMFSYERYLHLGAAILAFLMMVYAGGRLIATKDVTVDLLVALFGSSGLITVSAARISYFFNKAFSLIEDIVRKLLQL